VIGFRFTLTDQDGTEHEITADSRDVLAWEKTSRSNETMRDLLADMSVSKYYRLAHIAARRQDIGAPKDRAEFESSWLVDLNSKEPVTPTSGEASIET